MNTQGPDIHRLSLRFADKTLEAQYSLEQAQRTLRPIRIALISAAALGVFFLWPFSFLMGPEIQAHMPKIVLLCVVLTGTCLAITYRPVFLAQHQRVLLLMALIMTLGLLFGTSYSPTREASGFFMTSLHLFSIYGVFRLRFPLATIAGWSTLIMYLAFMFGLGHIPEYAAPRHFGALVMTNLWGMLICYQMDLAARRTFLATRKLAEEHARSDELLLNILPASLAKELASTGSARPARHESATILFTDLSGFTQASSSMPAERMVAELNEIFSAFDDICAACGIEKIKTIGDAYMAAAGIPVACDDHARRCVTAGLRMTAFIEQRNRQSAFKWGLRVGIHSGPVVAGVVGKHKYAFDVWGDTVNVASRMESAGEVGRVNVSAYTCDLVRNAFECEYRGKVEAKGKGAVDMYFVTPPLSQDGADSVP